MFYFLDGCAQNRRGQDGNSRADRLASWLAALLVGTGVAGIGALGSQALAQEKKPAAQKQSAWVKICDTVQIAKEQKKKICITHHERLDGNTGMVLVSAGIRNVEGAKSERFLVMVPLGMALPPGIQVRIDDDKEPIKLRYTLCHVGGCTAETDATPELIKKLQQGKQMLVAAINAAGKPIGFPVPLNGFTAAYKGKPVDSKKYANARRQLLMAIRKRQIARAKALAEQRKKQQESQKKKKK